MSMQPSEDDRVLAALSHASIVANAINLAGMITTSLILTMHRDRSPYVRAHALQALVYQGAVLLVMLFLGLFGGLCLVLSLLPALLRPDLYRASPPSYSLWIGALTLLALISCGALATLYGLFGAYQVYRGRSFRYPLIGRLVRPLLTPTPVAAPVAPASVAAQPELNPVNPANPVKTPPAPAPPEAAPETVEPPVAVAAPVEPVATAVAPTMPKRRSRKPAGDGDS